jgi:sugar-specific transcriptional regulator TrmB
MTGSVWYGVFFMIVKKEFLSKLKDFGLNSYEAKIWCALLSRGVSTAGELSDIAAVPRSRSYDVLESLERKGFIITKLGKPFKYLAVSPSEVVERVKKNVKEEAEKSVKALDEIKNTELLDELNLLHTQGVDTFDPTEKTGYIKSRDNIYAHIEKMVNNAHSNIVIACSANELLNKYKYMGDALKQANKRDVKIKMLVSGPMEPVSSKLPELKELAEIKSASSGKNRFIIVDDKESLMLLQDEEKIHPLYDTAIWINSEFMVSSLCAMFDHTWKNSDKI